jgi:hypothetical protein
VPVYAYAHNNPLYHTDPTGNVAPLAVAATVAARCAVNVACRNAVAHGARAAGQFIARNAGTLIRAGTIGAIQQRSQTAVQSESAAEPGKAAVEGVLKPGGKLIGEAGSSKDIREVPGGADEALDLYEDIVDAAGGSTLVPTANPDSPVMVDDLEGGIGRIKVNTVPDGRSGDATIEVDIPGIGIRKIKFIDPKDAAK